MAFEELDRNSPVMSAASREPALVALPSLPLSAMALPTPPPATHVPGLAAGAEPIVISLATSRSMMATDDKSDALAAAPAANTAAASSSSSSAAVATSNGHGSDSGGGGGDVKVSVGSGKTQKIFINIGGMTCTNCSSTIETALAGIAGVVSGKVSLMQERAEVVFDPSVDGLTADKLVSEIGDVGFEASLATADVKGRVTLLVTGAIDSDERRDTVKRVLLQQPAVIDVNIREEDGDSLAAMADPASAADDLAEPVSKLGAGAGGDGSGGGGRSTLIELVVDLHRAKIRDLLGVLETQCGLTTRTIHNDGSLEARKRAMLHRQNHDLHRWRFAFWVSLAFTVPITLIAMVFPMSETLGAITGKTIIKQFSVGSLLLWVLATPVQFGIGSRFYSAAWKSLKHGGASMDVLIAVGSSAAYGYSVVSVVMACYNARYHAMTYFDTSAMLICLVVGGRFLEHKAKGRTSEALSALMSLAPSTATLCRTDDAGVVVREEEVDTALVQLGDILKVVRGAKIPVDGVVVKGRTSVDESLVTGESMPVLKDVGSTVIGATVNVDGVIQFRATGVGSETALSKIVRLVEDAQSSKAPIQAFADRIARVFVPGMLLLSLLTLVVWYLLLATGVAPSAWMSEGMDEFLFSFMMAVSVLVISCPCALGLATPTAVMVATGVGARLGVLFKGGEPLEITGKVTAVLFDKTGTLTQGKPSVNEQQTVLKPDAVGLTRTQLWTLIGTTEAPSEHLLGRAIVEYARRVLSQDGAGAAAAKDAVFPEADKFEAETGLGVRAKSGAHTVLIGSDEWLTAAANAVTIDKASADAMHAVQSTGNIGVFVAVNGKVAGVIAVADAPKLEAPAVIHHLHAQGIATYLVTGDNIRVARAVADSVGIPLDNVIAGVKPSEKAAVVERLQSQLTARGGDDNPHANAGHSGKKEVVMFVGDGVNDSPALAVADVGVAIGAGTDIAIETAQVVLMRPDLTDVLTAIDLSKTALTRIRWNFLWAVIYNVVSIPLAAGVFFPWLHTTVPPEVAAAAMGFSSISVVLSSLWLKRYTRPTFSLLVGPGHAPGAVVDGEVNNRAGAKTRKGKSGGGAYTALDLDDDDPILTLDDGHDGLGMGMAMGGADFADRKSSFDIEMGAAGVSGSLVSSHGSIVATHEL